MISDNEFLAIVQGLLDKTSKERLGWQQKKSVVTTPEGKLSKLPGAVFRLQLPASVIELEYASPRAENDYIVFTLLRGSDQQSVAQRQVFEGDLGWNQLFDLYALVSRQVLGWDSVMKDVQSFLQGSTPQPVS
jgi:hypothetical protein